MENARRYDDFKQMYESITDDYTRRKLVSAADWAEARIGSCHGPNGTRDGDADVGNQEASAFGLRCEHGEMLQAKALADGIGGASSYHDSVSYPRKYCSVLEGRRVQGAYCR